MMIGDNYAYSLKEIIKMTKITYPNCQLVQKILIQPDGLPKTGGTQLKVKLWKAEPNSKQITETYVELGGYHAKYNSGTF